MAVRRLRLREEVEYLPSLTNKQKSYIKRLFNQYNIYIEKEWDNVSIANDFAVPEYVITTTPLTTVDERHNLSMLLDELYSLEEENIIDGKNGIAFDRYVSDYDEDAYDFHFYDWEL